MTNIKKEIDSRQRISRRQFIGNAAGGVMAAAGPTILGATDKAGLKRPIVGSREHTYEVIHGWGQLPKHIRYGNTHGVKIDSQGFVYIHHTVHPTSESSDSMVVFDADGEFVKSWGAEFKGGAHGLHINREGGEEFLYLCDIQRNIVVKTTLNGETIFTLGYPDQSDAYRPGADGTRPKYTPTNLAIGPNGDLYVGDGYGSSYVILYNKNGEYLQTFGGPGEDPGQLKVPHGIMVDYRGEQPLLVVADRSNHRLQYFTLDGKHLRFEYGVNLPCHFDTLGGELLVPDLAARVSIMDKNNKVIVHLGRGPDDWAKRRTMSRENLLPGKFVCPHGACYDRDGNIFVVEWVEIGRVSKLRKVA